MSEQQTIIIADWHSLAIEVAQGERTDPAGPLPNQGIAIAATQLGDEVVLMIALADAKGQSLAAPLRMDEWNRFTALIQLALMDASKLELARLEKEQRNADSSDA